MAEMPAFHLAKASALLASPGFWGKEGPSEERAEVGGLPLEEEEGAAWALGRTQGSQAGSDQAASSSPAIPLGRDQPEAQA